MPRRCVSGFHRALVCAAGRDLGGPCYRSWRQRETVYARDCVQADIPTATAKMRLVQIADEIVSVLGSDPNANIRLMVEIAADFPDGASDTLN